MRPRGRNIVVVGLGSQACCFGWRQCRSTFSESFEIGNAKEDWFGSSDSANKHREAKPAGWNLLRLMGDRDTNTDFVTRAVGAVPIRRY